MSITFLLTAPTTALGTAEALALPSLSLANRLVARAYDPMHARYVVADKAGLRAVPHALLLGLWRHWSPKTYPITKLSVPVLHTAVWDLILQHALRLRQSQTTLA